jgi:hypothetical protein
MKSKLTITMILLAFVQVANANLIRNASFEDIPGAFTGQGIMPSEWTIVNVTPDTYSNDGSYGLSPSVNGNFTGVTAQDGVRWVAGWSSAFEFFGQALSVPLIGDQSYTLSSYLIQAKRSDLDHFGGYEVYLTSGSASITGELLGNIGPTTNSNDWEFSSLTFIAPTDSSILPFLLFKPYGDILGGAYPGLDNLNLSATSIGEVPVPAAVWLFGTALVGFIGVSRRRKIA